MAINKKHFRKINVNDVIYYWRVTPDQMFFRLLVIEDGDSNLSALTAYFSQFDFRDSLETIITPSLVRQAIEYGLEHGWRPLSKEDNFRIGDADDCLKLDDHNKFFQHPCDSSCKTCKGKAA